MSPPTHNLASTLRRLSNEEEIPPLTWQFVSESVANFRGIATRQLTLRVGRVQLAELNDLVVGHKAVMAILLDHGIQIQALALESFYRVVERS